VSDTSDLLERILERRPDFGRSLLGGSKSQALVRYFQAFEILQDQGVEPTFDAIMAWIDSRYPPPRLRDPGPARSFEIPETGTRPKVPPDLRRAMREAITQLVRDRRKLTWDATAQQIRDNFELDTYDPSRLRARVKEEGLPKPWDPYWLNPE
jgi:hypothetical protein